MLATSPVCSQPSSSTAVGALRYPIITTLLRTSSSPSDASLTSTPGDGGPTVPILIRSAGFEQPAPQVSLIPQISASGTPIAWKNRNISRGVGAAPTLTSLA